MSLYVVIGLSIILSPIVVIAFIGAVPDRWWPAGGDRVDNRLARLVAELGGTGGLDGYHAYLKEMPAFRLADLHRALSALTETASAAERIDTEHHEALAAILAGNFNTPSNRRVRRAESVARAVAEGEDGFFPTDGFRVLALPGYAAPLIVRLKYDAYTRSVRVEVGASTNDEAKRLMKDLLDHAGALSVYRGKTLEVAFDAEVRDEYGDMIRGESIDLRFRPTYRIARDEIVLEPEKAELLDRVLLDFHDRRVALRALGLPSRRGVLFYGPPGTGKTHTCKYLSQRLSGATTLLATGKALLHARSICQIARMLQPALVVLEDVDLVYSQREENAYGVALGELMDELDGFARDDEILFVLTTNAIDRVEAAVKDRPGRISQCVLFDVPDRALRSRYLTALLAPYDTSGLDLDAVVAMTDRTSQAFLKELVFRAVQVSTESEPVDRPEDVRMTEPVLRLAFDEMKAGAGTQGAAILGFYV